MGSSKEATVIFQTDEWGQEQRWGNETGEKCLIYESVWKVELTAQDIERTVMPLIEMGKMGRQRVWKSRCGRLNNAPLPSIHVLIPGTCEYVTLYGKGKR